MENVKKFIADNRERILEELFSVLRIKSISSLPEHKQDMYAVAERVKLLLEEAGVDKAKIYDTEGNPVLYAEKMVDPKLPTVLIYGHLDVMPVDPIELWHSDPFEPKVVDGRIVCRGANDDKGQLMIHLKAFEYLVKSNTLNCNVKFMLEGEEEIGSTSLYKFCEEHKEMLKADVILVSDTSMIASDTPAVTLGLRGLAYMEIEVTGPNKDLHSGLFGGAVANPANVLTKIIASLTDEQGRVTIPGFYDDVLTISDEVRAEMNKAPFNLDSYKQALDINEVEGEKGYTTIERTGIRPCLDVNGIWSGYIGEGTKTVLPSKAYAKVSMRLVANQDYRKISKLFKEHIEKIAPPYVKVKVTEHHGGFSYSCPADLPAYKAAEKAYLDVFGKKPIPMYSGGSIPIIAAFDKILGIKALLMGFGLEEDAIHSPNESFGINRLFSGIESVAMFYKYFSK